MTDEDGNVQDRLGAVVDESFDVQAVAAEEVQLRASLSGPGEDGQSESQDVSQEGEHRVFVSCGG